MLLISSGASATECQSSPSHDGKWWSYRIVDSKRCWYQGSPGRSKSLLHWAKPSPPPVVTRPDPGDSPPPAPPVPPQQPPETVDITPKVVSTVSIPAPTSKAPQMAAPPPSLPEPPPLPAKPKAVEVVDAALDHSSHRDRAGGRRITVSTSAMDLVQEFRRRWTNWQASVAGHLDLMGDSLTQWSRRASTPIQSDTTSPSSERPSPVLGSVAQEQTKQFADDIRSQVARMHLLSRCRLPGSLGPGWPSSSTSREHQARESA